MSTDLTCSLVEILAATGSLTAEQAVETNSPVPKGGEQVLLIDDEEAIVKMRQRMIERLGYDVAIQNSSLKAFETFKDGPDGYDLIITDMTMSPYDWKQTGEKA